MSGTAKAASPGKRALLALMVMAGLAMLAFAIPPGAAYPWMKALHIVAVIAWMAGMLYLPRLFVYHADATIGSQMSETFKVMERRLLRFIINPAMLVTWAAGLWLAWHGFAFGGGWLHAKIAAVLALSGVHGYFSASVRRFAADRNKRPARHWRIMNEVPTVIMVIVVILVVVKPF